MFTLLMLGKVKNSWKWTFLVMHKSLLTPQGEFYAAVERTYKKKPSVGFQSYLRICAHSPSAFSVLLFNKKPSISKA